MAYEKIGTIEDVSEIQFDENIIVNGRVDKAGWMWHMGGMFMRKENEIVFKNEYGMVTKVEDGEISLNIMRKVNKMQDLKYKLAKV